MKHKIIKTLLISILSVVCLFCFCSIAKSNKHNSVKALTQNDVVYYGNDISFWQENVNFNKMNSVSDFVILRMGYGTSLDTRFVEYMNGAIAAGLPVGVYIFSLATNTAEAINEANWVINTLEQYGFDDGDLTFPIYFDYEADGTIQSKTNAENTAIVNAFVDVMWNAGYYPGLYMGGYNFVTHLNLDDLHCDAWVAAYFYSNTNFSSFTAKYGYHKSVKMWQFCDGQVPEAVKNYGSTCGVSTTYIDENWCFVDYPKIIKDGGYNSPNATPPTPQKPALPIKSTTILNDAMSGWDLTYNYNPSNPNFANRKITLNSFDGDNNVYFNQFNTTQLKVGATFKATGKSANELWGKFGIGFFNSVENGFFTYVDAYGTTGETVSNIIGTNVAVVAKNPANPDAWDWGLQTNYAIAENVYSSTSPITIEVDRKGINFDIYVNGNFVKTICGSDYSLSETDKITPVILSFNTYLEVTNYYSTPTHEYITIDGDLSDWKSLSNWNDINNNKKQALDTQSDKGATFYTIWTTQGLYIYAEAKHHENATGLSDWWQNTTFEIIINENLATSQYYAIHSQIRGFTSFYFATTGTEGNYTSTLEAFIEDCELFSSGINIGFAFKIRDYTNNVHDYITLSDGTQTDKWFPENKSVDSLPFVLTQEVIKIGSSSSTPTSSQNSSSSSISNANNSSLDISNNSSLSTSSTNNSSSSSVNSQNSNVINSPSSSNINSSITKPTSSTTSSDNISNENISSNNSTTENTSKGKKGCGGSINALYIMLPLAFIAIMVFTKKTKNQ